MVKNIFLHIYKEYVERIQHGQLVPGTKLPSESELAAEYGTTRETVRKALNLLVQNGYIHKMKGKGSFVLDVHRMDFPITGLISFKEMAEKLGKPTKTAVYKTCREPASPEIARNLQIQPGDPVWAVIRSRDIDGERVILDKDYFLPEIVPELTEDIASKSIYDYLENELGLKISYAKKEISVEESTDEDRRLLDYRGMSHVVVVRNYVYLEDTTLFQFTESRHRLDKFQFVDFARRVH
ncbi:trehalose operon repressor [Paenibacillus pinistramenti]|uniref:trehalose operon repressor n=1 Tax=Paenibacillus pinistramenti TaxID=1768003 RepID=UPI00110892AC|nr:trehalose operon repressor [Paenibacillus pinistramenti]